MRTLMETIKFEQLQRDSVEKVDAFIAKCTSFKIGKTGETLLDRFSQPDYNDVYTHIIGVFAGERKDVDDMESYLIDKYMNHPKCENKKDGDASNSDTMADYTTVFYVYIVWNELK